MLCVDAYSANQLVTKELSVGAPSARKEAMTRARMARVMAALNKNIGYSIGLSSLVFIGRVVLQRKRRTYTGLCTMLHP